MLFLSNVYKKTKVQVVSTCIVVVNERRIYPEHHILFHLHRCTVTLQAISQIARYYTLTESSCVIMG